jgi:exodeoxyribonuclease VII small subunit
MVTTQSTPSAGPAEAGSGSSPASFESALQELEALVQQMEAGTLTLEQSMAAYRRGAALVKQCRDALAGVQQQVRVLEGELLQPFEAVAERLSDE